MFAIINVSIINQKTEKIVSNAKESLLINSLSWDILAEVISPDAPVSIKRLCGLRGKGGDPVGVIQQLRRARLICYTRTPKTQEDRVLVATDDGMQIYKAAARHFREQAKAQEKAPSPLV